MPLHYVFAFDSKNVDEVNSAVRLVRSLLPQDANLSIGVSSEGKFEFDGVRNFPANTGIAQMLNNLIAALPHSSTVVIGNGLSVPKFGADDTADEYDCDSGEFFSLPVRVPIVPPYLDESLVSSQLLNLDFTKKHADSTPGILIANQKYFMKIRGFDERLEFAAALFMDLLARMTRDGSYKKTGSGQTFAADLNQVVNVSESESKTLTLAEQNDRHVLVASDASIYRNLTNWSVPKKLRTPLVSVAIATRDRSEYLRDCIMSVQNQTFEDWELIIVDDGSEDDTETVVKSFSDSRIVFLRQEKGGISRARNLAADRSQGFYTAVHDDDDIMLPWRLEEGLRILSANVQAAYGSWVNFQNTTGEMALHITKLSFGKDLVSFSGQTPGHATWLLPTSYVKILRYDETLTSSVDHNLAVRTVMSGLRWAHTGKVLFIRRIHDTQVSVTDSKRQKNAAIATRMASTFTMTAKAYSLSVDRGKALKFPNPVDRSKLFENFGLYLPDHLVTRSLRIGGLVGKKILALDLHDKFNHIIAEQDLISDKSTLEVGGVTDLKWSDLVRIREYGFVGLTWRFTKRRPDIGVVTDGNETLSGANEISARVGQALKQTRANSQSGVLVHIVDEVVAVNEIVSSPGVILAKHLTMNSEPNLRDSRILVGFSSKKHALTYLNSGSHARERATVMISSLVDFDLISNDYVGVAQ